MELFQLVDGVLTRRIADPVFSMECDVLCVGAGSAGIYAADAAAQNGASVILLENDVTVGGMHILGDVRGCYYGFHGGNFEEDSVGKTDPHFYFRTDKKRIDMLRRLERSGVKLLCGCAPTGVFVEEGRVVGLLAFDGVKELALKANITVDATSDGFLLRMLPVEKYYGRLRDGKMAPYSVIATAWKDDRYAMVNRDAGYIDPYDSDDFSRKAMLAHGQAADLLKKEFLNLASHTGVREGLRFAGEETLRYEDTLLRRQPEKILFWAYSDLDLHGHLRALDEELFQVWWVLCNMATVALRIPVPLGSIVPKGFKGIVTAGRCLSADSYMSAAVRMNRDMFRMGQCVGTAAAMAPEGDILALDYAEYLRRVENCFSGEEGKTMGYDSPHRDVPYRPVEADPEKNWQLLKTDTPGPFFWSAFCCGDKGALAEKLLQALEDEEDGLCRKNAALALGILGDKRSLPMLREMVENRDAFYYKDCRRSNQFQSVMAVWLLSRLGEEADIPLLRQIVFEAAEFERPIYHALKPNRLYYGGKDRNFLYFDMVTHAGAGLVRLHRRLGLSTAQLHRDFVRLQQEGVLVQRIAPECTPEKTPYAETVDFLREMVRITE